ncbi:hypothetical protein [Microcystis phage MaeS]|nr:hypothetical protein [Microcystis phage MaeS]
MIKLLAYVFENLGDQHVHKVIENASIEDIGKIADILKHTSEGNQERWNGIIENILNLKKRIGGR